MKSDSMIVGQEGGYRTSIPLEIREELDRYGNSRSLLYNLFVGCRGALDLSRSNPALAYALANCEAFRKRAPVRPIHSASHLVHRRQTIILEWLGFPRGESSRRIMSKISPDALSVPFLLWLRQALSDPGQVKVLRHLRCVNQPLVRLLLNREMSRHVTPSFLQDVGGMLPGEKHDWIDSQLSDSLGMATGELRKYCPQRFHSLAHLRATHADLVERTNARNRLPWWATQKRQEWFGGRFPFPPPPFAGTADIRPLDTAEAVAQEGIAMNNCVGSYPIMIENGELYLYQVLRPVRATLAILKCSEKWDPADVEMAGNVPVSEEIKRELFKALAHSGPGVPGGEPALLRFEQEPAAVEEYPVEWDMEPMFINPEPVVTRDELGLEEGQRAPLAWNELNPNQLPLLPPQDHEILRRVMTEFCGSGSVESTLRGPERPLCPGGI